MRGYLEVICTSVLCDAVAMSRWFLCATRFCSRAQELKVLSLGLCLGQAFTVAAKDVSPCFQELWLQLR